MLRFTLWLAVVFCPKHRFAKYFKSENGTEFRRLHKAFAIRFDVMVTGTVSCGKVLAVNIY